MSSNVPLDAEERELLESFERDEWRPIRDDSRSLREYQEYATSALEDAGIVSILLPRHDLRVLRQRAAETGTPYQSLIANIVHLYVTGQLIEKPNAA
jgi:predicted DNA binding CopG/RHH family protein